MYNNNRLQITRILTISMGLIILLISSLSTITFLFATLTYYYRDIENKLFLFSTVLINNYGFHFLNSLIWTILFVIIGIPIVVSIIICISLLCYSIKYLLFKYRSHHSTYVEI